MSERANTPRFPTPADITPPDPAAAEALLHLLSATQNDLESAGAGELDETDEENDLP